MRDEVEYNFSSIIFSCKRQWSRTVYENNRIQGDTLDNRRMQMRSRLYMNSSITKSLKVLIEGHSVRYRPR